MQLMTLVHYIHIIYYIYIVYVYILKDIENLGEMLNNERQNEDCPQNAYFSIQFSL